MSREEEFSDIFDKLVVGVANLGKIGINDDETRFIKVMDKTIEFFNKEMGTNFGIVHDTKDRITKITPNAFMFALEDKMHYSSDLIKEFKRNVKNTKSEKYDAKYDDVTFALMLLNTTSHELWHCFQHLEYKNGTFLERTYFNALSHALNRFSTIEYLERDYEGDAYGAGVSKLFSFCNKDFLRSSIFLNSFEKQKNSWNFFSKNICFASTAYWLNQIPFVMDGNEFIDLPTYANNYISKLELGYIDKLVEEYPQIAVGLNKNGQVKSPYTLMDQYFNKEIQYNGKTSKLDTREQESLLDIYIYLLVPNMTPEIYNGLCIKYGNEKMDIFSQKMKDKINEKMTLYKKATNEGLKGVKSLHDDPLLNGITEEYVINKSKKGCSFLNECMSKLDSFTKKDTSQVKK